MKVLVLQLCRMGDVVQTLPVVEALAAEGHEVHVVLRESFRGLPLPRAVSRVHVFSSNAPDVGERLAERARFLRGLASERFDTVVNLSHDAESAAMARFAGAPDVRGVTLEDDRNFGLRGAWMEYLLTLTANRRLGPFNLADVYRRVAGVDRLLEPRIELPARARARARELLDGLEARPLVGLVPGASDPRKCWSAASFAELARALGEGGASVVLLGTEAERDLAETIRRGAGDRAKSFAGATSLSELAALLGSIDLVVTNDTGTMHLAAACGARTLTVTLGPAYVHESAPYGSGHVAIQPELHCHPCDFASFCGDPVCRDEVSPRSVLAIARAMLSDAPLEGIDVAGCEVLRTRFDEGGRLVACPVGRTTARPDDLLRLAYRELWERTLGGAEPSTASRLARELELDDASTAANCRLVEVGEGALALARALEAGVNQLLAALRSEGDASGDALRKLSEDVDRAGRLDAGLRPLAAHTLLRLQLVGARSRAAAGTELLRCLTSAAHRARTLHAIVAELAEAVESSAASTSSA